ncbi:MAG: hypothetical protein CBC09_02720 [Cellvibrionales bacterium TMED49]|nr:hypothetical protein [Porticoccaceae bacterium]OUU39307.1 MAG: hypothetical protein CBC09_02720 [Cellvibrionales bacterium TMED49]|tara:strand:+ start:111 stop:956 length:846 start_codon:yes stop_codon:yes gene_type:complete
MKISHSFKRSHVYIILLCVVIAGLVSTLFLINHQNGKIDSSLVSTSETDKTAAEKPIDPIIPEAIIPSLTPKLVTQEVDTTVVEQVTLPTLNESDSFLRDNLSIISSDSSFLRWITKDDLFRRVASYFDGLSRGVILNKIFPLSAPEGDFTIHKSGDELLLNAGNYERYSKTIDVILSVDMALIAEVFHNTRPLLEAAFAEMGYNSRQMDGIILQSIEQILSTPIIARPIALSQESVLYQFADPDLEQLSPIQKQLLRAGPENTQKLQFQALELKDALLNP